MFNICVTFMTLLCGDIMFLKYFGGRFVLKTQTTLRSDICVYIAPYILCKANKKIHNQKKRMCTRRISQCLSGIGVAFFFWRWLLVTLIFAEIRLQTYRGHFWWAHIQTFYVNKCTRNASIQMVVWKNCEMYNNNNSKNNTVTNTSYAKMNKCLEFKIRYSTSILHFSRWYRQNIYP